MLDQSIIVISKLYGSFPCIEKIEVLRDNLIEITTDKQKTIFSQKESVELLEWLENQ